MPALYFFCMGKGTISATLKYQLYEKGWAVVSLSRRNELDGVREALRAKIRELTNRTDLELEDYHSCVEDDVTHTQWHFELTQFFRENKLGQRVIESECEFFQSLLGPDLNIQSSPYLRITRPGLSQDNIDFHRDTLYGHTPYELSVSVAYVDIPAASALSVLSGSHVSPDKDYPTTQFLHPEVEKGSIKNQLGFLYAPKRFRPEQLIGAEPVPLQTGQILIFSQALIHGSQVNRGVKTRWTSDTRVVNSWVPLRSELKSGYYERWSRSVVSEFGKAYDQAQEST